MKKLERKKEEGEGHQDGNVCVTQSTKNDCCKIFNVNEEEINLVLFCFKFVHSVLY